jgi:hypothetical protein
MNPKGEYCPEEYFEYKLMTEKYHCTPTEFDNQPAVIIEMHKEFMKLESNRNKLEDKRRAQQNRMR